MFDKQIVCNYIVAKYACAGIDLDLFEVNVPDEIINGKDIRIKSLFKPTRLDKAVDVYTGALRKSGAPKHEIFLLGNKLKYILKVYESYTTDPILVSIESFHNSSINLLNLARIIFRLSKDNPHEYTRLMQVDGEVLISRFVLEKFWHSDFADFIDFIRDSLNNQMKEIADALWAISYSLKKCYHYEYRRRINAAFNLKVTFSAEDWFEYERFLDFITLTDGTNELRRNDERILCFFEKAAKGKNLPVTVNFDFVDNSGNEITSYSTASYVTSVRRGRFQVVDYRDLVREAFDDFRSELGTA